MGNLTINEVRAKVLLSRPYYGAAAMSARLIETHGIGTFAIDRYWRIYYDPAALVNWTNEECAAAFEHELNHVLRDHHERQQGREAQKWNRAGDREINDGISGLPQGCLYPADINAPEGEIAEVYFDLEPPQPQGPSGTCIHGPCGGGSGAGNPIPGELPAPDGTPQNRGVTPIEGGAIRRDTADAVKRYGNCAGGLQRWADSILNPPRIHWSKILPAAVRSAVAQGTPVRYRYPSRRETGQFIMPRLVGSRPAASLVIDTSGSMTDDDLALAIAVTKQAAKEIELSIYACDTEATRVSRLAPGAIIGGGGTNMMEGIRVALEGKPKPCAVVIISDCYSPWDAVGPKVPVVILTANPDQAPPWAKVIEVVS